MAHTRPLTGPNWLIEGKRVMSVRDYAELKCCGRAPGSCADCPIIVPQTTAPLFHRHKAQHGCKYVFNGCLHPQFCIDKCEGKPE